MAKKHLKINVFGKVQGVGFRFNTRRIAKKLGLVGFVKNKPDGSVYIEVEGDEKGLEKFISWCKEGPNFAKVKRIEKEEGAGKEFDKFEIRY